MSLSDCMRWKSQQSELISEWVEFVLRGTSWDSLNVLEGGTVDITKWMRVKEREKKKVILSECESGELIERVQQVRTRVSEWNRNTETKWVLNDQVSEPIRMSKWACEWVCTREKNTEWVNEWVSWVCIKREKLVQTKCVRRGTCGFN